MNERLTRDEPLPIGTWGYHRLGHPDRFQLWNVAYDGERVNVGEIYTEASADFICEKLNENPAHAQGSDLREAWREWRDARRDFLDLPPLKNNERVPPAIWNRMANAEHRLFAISDSQEDNRQTK